MPRNNLALARRHDYIDPRPKTHRSRPRRKNHGASAEPAGQAEPEGKRTKQQLDESENDGAGMQQMLQRTAGRVGHDVDAADVVTQPQPDEEDEWQTVGPDDDDDAANGDRLGPGVFFGGAVEDELEDDAKPITGSGLRSAKELMAPPTREEMAQLHETQQLFRSNLLRMQLEEMLPTLHVKPARRKAISEALHRLRALLLAIPAQQRRKVSLSDPPSKCAPPITVALHSADDLSFVFKPPSNVAVVGSFMVSTQARPDVSVDVAVELPTGMFEDKDRLNHRYAHLRAYYLGVLADALSESDDFVDVEFTNFQDNPLRPILQCRPAGDGKAASTIIRIFPSLSRDAFKLSKLAPSRNNVRRAKNTQLLSGAAAAASADNDTEVATPHYNQSILQDMFFRDHLEAIHAWTTGSHSSSFVDAILMLKTWLRQRQMDKYHAGTFTGFHATMLLVHLLQSHQLSREASSYQMFRKALTALADSQWDTKPLVMARPNDYVATEGSEAAEAFQKAFDVVFLDRSGHVNFLCDVSRAAYSDLKLEARAGLRLLDSEDADGFESLFMQEVLPEHKYDMLVRVSLHSRMVAAYPNQMLDWGGRWDVIGTRMVVAAITHGLTDRAKLVVPLSMPARSWAVTSKPAVVLDRADSASKDAAPVEIARAVGVQLDAQIAERTMDMGPDAEDKSACAAYRSFWGEIAQVRRFQDSSIRESVLWECTPEQQPQIAKWIVLHVLQRHCHMPAARVLVQRQWLDSALRLAHEQADVGSLQCRRILQTFEKLAHHIRRIKLPLTVMSLQGIDPVFRYAEVFPTPQPDGYVQVHKLVLRLESSARWPDSPVAMEHVKLAFFIRMARDLASMHGVQATRVVAPAGLRVLFRDVCFEIELFTQNELHLLRRTVREAEVLRLKATAAEEIENLQAQRTAAAAALAAKEYRFTVLPLVTGMLHSIHTASPSFGPAARLAKRWMAAHLLTPYVNEETVELLVASLYYGAQPFAAPGAAHVGFLRFLRLLSTHDFDSEPIVVDPHGEISHGALAEMRRTFREERAALPPIFIGTPQSGTTSPFTQSGPSRQILLRMVGLARSSLQLARSMLAIADAQVSIEELATADVMALFRTPLEDYDVVIHLQQPANPRRFQQLETTLKVKKPYHKGGKGSKAGKFGKSGKAGKSGDKTEGSAKRSAAAAAASEDNDDGAVVVEDAVSAAEVGLAGYDPTARYAAELQAEFGHLALFFYDAFGGDKICAIFTPDARAPAHDHATELADRRPFGKKQTALNIPAIVTTWAAMGEGLVEQIVVQKA